MTQLSPLAFLLHRWFSPKYKSFRTIILKGPQAQWVGMGGLWTLGFLCCGLKPVQSSRVVWGFWCLCWEPTASCLLFKNAWLLPSDTEVEGGQPTVQGCCHLLLGMTVTLCTPQWPHRQNPTFRSSTQPLNRDCFISPVIEKESRKAPAVMLLSAMWPYVAKTLRRAWDKDTHGFTRVKGQLIHAGLCEMLVFLTFQNASLLDAPHSKNVSESHWNICYCPIQPNSPSSHVPRSQRWVLEIKQSNVLKLSMPPKDNQTEPHCFKEEGASHSGHIVVTGGLMINPQRGCAGERSWHHSCRRRFFKISCLWPNMCTRNTRFLLCRFLWHLLFPVVSWHLSNYFSLCTEILCSGNLNASHFNIHIVLFTIILLKVHTYVLYEISNYKWIWAPGMWKNEHIQILINTYIFGVNNCIIFRVSFSKALC